MADDDHAIAHDVAVRRATTRRLPASRLRVLIATGLVLLAAAWACAVTFTSDGAGHYTSNGAAFLRTKEGAADRPRRRQRRRLSARDAVGANRTATRGLHHRADLTMPRLRSHHMMPAEQATIDQSHRALFGGEIHLERTTYKIPYVLEQNLADWEDGPVDLTKEMPVFWHVLKSGGTTIKTMYSQCFRLVEACETGIAVDKELQERNQLTGGQAPGAGAQAPVGQQRSGPSPWEWMQQQQLQQQAQPAGFDYGTNNRQRRRLEPMPYAPSGVGSMGQPQQENGQQLRVVTSDDGRKYLNVDVTTPEGILSASQLGFASSNLAEIVFTPLIHESAQYLLDSDSKKGRMFSVFRHPVERVTSLFYYLQGATWEPTYNPMYASWTIDDYARSEHCESNWMVRALTNKMTGPLSPEDILVAQEILRKKVIVGLMDRMGESMVHFQAYFGFKNSNTYYGNAIKCAQEKFAAKGSVGSNVHDHPVPERGSETWQILEQKNGLDLRLFEYAEKLFEEQGKRFAKEIDSVTQEATKKNIIF